MSLTILQLKNKLDSNSDISIIDVRSEAEVQAGLIPGAKWISMSGSAKEFMEKILALPKEKAYCVYCASGGRSDMAVSFMKENGFTNVEDLEGGISSWLAGGNDIQRIV